MKIFGDVPNWNKIFKALDTNQEGRIRFQQFLVGAFDKPRILNDENLQIAFKLLDIDGDGRLEVNEFRSCFEKQKFDFFETEGIPVDEDFWVKLIKDMDKD